MHHANHLSFLCCIDNLIPCGGASRLGICAKLITSATCETFILSDLQIQCGGASRLDICGKLIMSATCKTFIHYHLQIQCGGASHLGICAKLITSATCKTFIHYHLQIRCGGASRLGICAKLMTSAACQSPAISASAIVTKSKALESAGLHDRGEMKLETLSPSSSCPKEEQRSKHGPYRH